MDVVVVVVVDVGVVSVVAEVDVEVLEWLQQPSSDIALCSHFFDCDAQH